MTMNEAKMKSALASDNLTIINDRLLAKSAVLVPLIKTDSGEDSTVSGAGFSS